MAPPGHFIWIIYSIYINYPGPVYLFLLQSPSLTVTSFHSLLNSHLLPRTEYRGPSNCFSHPSPLITHHSSFLYSMPHALCSLLPLVTRYFFYRGPSTSFSFALAFASASNSGFSRHLRQLWHLRHFFYLLTAEIQPNVLSMELIHPRIFREISPQLILFAHFLQGSFPDIIIHGFHDHFWGKFGDDP